MLRLAFFGDKEFWGDALSSLMTRDGRSRVFLFLGLFVVRLVTLNYLWRGSNNRNSWIPRATFFPAVGTLALFRNCHSVRSLLLPIPSVERAFPAGQGKVENRDQFP